MNKNNLTIAVLSGKGGTGKTFVSVNLAAAAPLARYYDCDVEEPNGHLFFKPENICEEIVSVPIPIADETKCDGCKTCVNFCRFHALAYAGGRLMVFEDVCHSCGGCVLVCPRQAITEVNQPIGRISKGQSESVAVCSGMMDTGVESGVPIIRKLLENQEMCDGLSVIDCPPGSACTVTESIRNADICILVAEPSIFGAHNLDMVYRLCRMSGKPVGVVLNKCTQGDNPSETYALANHIPVLASIPFDKELAYLNAEGRIAVREKESYRILFRNLLQRIQSEVTQ